MNQDINSRRLVHESEMTESEPLGGGVKWILTRGVNQRTYQSGLSLVGSSGNGGTKPLRSIRHYNCVRGSKRHSGDGRRKA